MNDTGHFVDPNESLLSIGESIRDLAYSKLEEECISNTRNLLGDRDSETVVHENGMMTFTNSDGNVYIVTPGGDADTGKFWDYLGAPLHQSGIFDYIPEALGRFAARGHHECDQILDLLSSFSGQAGLQSGRTVADISTPFKRVSSATEDWTGNTATSFSEFFVEPLPDATANVQNLVSELCAAVSGQKTLILSAAESARNIGLETRGTLVNYPGSVDAWNILMPIVGAALAFTSFVLVPPAGPVALTMGLLGLANTSVGAGKTITDAATSGSATSVVEIIESMNHALRELDSNVDAETDSVIDGLNTTLADLDYVLASDPETKRYLLPLRPSIADTMPEFDDFEAPSA